MTNIRRDAHEYFDSICKDLRIYMNADDPHEYISLDDAKDELCPIQEYGLSIHRHDPSGKTAGYWAWVLATGGPHYELRCYDGGTVEFAFSWSENETLIEIDDPELVEFCQEMLGGAQL